MNIFGYVCSCLPMIVLKPFPEVFNYGYRKWKVTQCTYVLHIRIISASNICGCAYDNKLRMRISNICGCSADEDANTDIGPINNGDEKNDDWRFNLNCIKRNYQYRKIYYLEFLVSWLLKIVTTDLVRGQKSSLRSYLT